MSGTHYNVLRYNFSGVCPVCRKCVKLDMFEREFTCPCFNSDRNVTSALVIMKERLCLWDTGETPGDENASAMMEYLKSIPHVSVSMNREAMAIRSG